MAETHSKPQTYQFKDIEGQKFGRLLVVEFSGRTTNRRLLWKCICECGREVVTEGISLRTGNTKSCGCLNRELAAQRKLTHGHSGRRGSGRAPEYTVWSAIKNRCFSVGCKSYRDYGERGITMCQRWAESFEAFLEDMGPKPTPKHTIERIDNDGNYEPGNCRWATRTEQARNKRNNVRLVFNGNEKSLAEWAEVSGINRDCLYQRICSYGWTVEKALTTPVGGA